MVIPGIYLFYEQAEQLLTSQSMPKKTRWGNCESLVAEPFECACGPLTLDIQACFDDIFGSGRVRVSPAPNKGKNTIPISAVRIP